MNCLLLFFFEVRLHHLNFVFILKEGKIRHITLIYAAYYSSHFHIYFHLFIFGFSSIPYQNIETWGKSSKNKICWVAYLFSFTCKQKLYMHKLIRFCRSSFAKRMEGSVRWFCLHNLLYFQQR